MNLGFHRKFLDQLNNHHKGFIHTINALCHCLVQRRNIQNQRKSRRKYLRIW